MSFLKKLATKYSVVSATQKELSDYTRGRRPLLTDKEADADY